MAFKRPVATRSRRAARELVSVTTATARLRRLQASLASLVADEPWAKRDELEARARELDRHLGLTRALRGESGATPFLLSSALAELERDVAALQDQ